MNKKSIRITDFAAQYWCERQMEYRYIYSKWEKSKEIEKGKAMHEVMESEVNIPVLMQPKSYSDYVYKVLYSNYMVLKSLKENKKARELQIFGNIEGFAISGKIDELVIKDNKIVIYEDKTKSNDNIPTETQMLPNKIQIIFYKKILDDMIHNKYGIQEFSKFYGVQKLKLSEEFISQLDNQRIDKNDQDIDKMLHLMFSSFSSLQDISDKLHIRYTNQISGRLIKEYTLTYNDNDFDNIKKHVMNYWKGTREALAVPYEEKWKCNYCVFFGNKCKIWWEDKQKVIK
ncbi:MAG: PD-(D/E)XK nuclease family protein [Candidatus Micrarchaeaceae archaeon]